MLFAAQAPPSACLPGWTVSNRKLVRSVIDIPGDNMRHEFEVNVIGLS